jgi:hypothetical protein
MSTLNGQNNEHDQKLLHAIEQIVQGEAHTTHEPHSALGVGARLAGTMPQPDAAFADRLEARLVTATEQRKEVTMNVIETQHAPNERRTATSGKQRASMWYAARWVGLGIAMMTLLSAFVPPIRSAVVQAADSVRALVGFSVQPGHAVSFTPDPPFALQQPEYVPAGFELTSQQYAPGTDPQTGQALPVGAAQAGRINGEQVDPSTSPLPAFSAPDAPHIMLEYVARDGHAFRIVERASQPDDRLPAGEARTINQQIAMFTSNYQLPTLTWIDQGTWIELQGTLPERELGKIAESFVTTQEPTPGNTNQVISADPSQQPTPVPSPLLPILGNVPQQQFHVRIVFMVGDNGGSGPGWGLSAYEADGQPLTIEETQTLFRAAIIALRDTSVPMQQVEYSDAYNPTITKYVVIEVWDQQINIGTTNDDESLREQAVECIEDFLKSIP